LLPAATACSLCSAARCHLAAAHRHSLPLLARCSLLVARSLLAVRCHRSLAATCCKAARRHHPLLPPLVACILYCSAVAAACRCSYAPQRPSAPCQRKQTIILPTHPIYLRDVYVRRVRVLLYARMYLHLYACMQALCSFCSHMDLQRRIQGPGKPHKLPSNPGKPLNQSVCYQLLFLTICTLLLAAAVTLLPPMWLAAVARHCSPFSCCCCSCCLLFLLLPCDSCQSVCYHCYPPPSSPLPMRAPLIQYCN
jgi:hypothetical protein